MHFYFQCISWVNFVSNLNRNLGSTYEDSTAKNRFSHEKLNSTILNSRNFNIITLLKKIQKENSSGKINGL